MKRFVFLLTTIFMCSILHAETFNQYWYVENNTPIQTTCETGGDITLPAAPTKYGYDFIGWEKLPIKRIEYLESTGTQYIDTGFVPNQDTYVKVKYSTIYNTSDAIILGSRQNYNSRAFYLVVGYNGDPAYFFINYNNGYVTPRIENRDVITEIELNKNKFYINGVLKNTLNYSVFTTPGSMCIFGCRCNGISVSKNKLRIYFTQIYDNDVLVRDFIPVLDPAGTPCMYDKVEGKFYYNAGTGDFIAGPVIGE